MLPLLQFSEIKKSLTVVSILLLEPLVGNVKTGDYIWRKIVIVVPEFCLFRIYNIDDARSSFVTAEDLEYKGQFTHCTQKNSCRANKQVYV